MLNIKKHSSRGFTLLEILLVIGIIAILAGIVIVAINPSKQLAVVRNTERKSDLKQLYNAITQYYIDNSAYPSTISTTTLNEVCNTGSVAATTTALNGASCGTLANLSVLVPTYLTAIPTDPTGTSSLLSFIPTAYAATTATGTGYKVGINTAKQVLISAPLAELGVRVVVGNVPTTVASTLGVGLVAHYLMNDTNGTTAVDSKGGYTGTGTYTANPSGKINAALSFNGSTYVGIPYSTDLQPQTGDYSVAFWINAQNYGAVGWNGVLDMRPYVTGTDNGWSIAFGVRSDFPDYHKLSTFFADGTSGWDVPSDGSNCSASIVTLNTWQHWVVIFARSEGKVRFYLNGVLDAERTPTNGYPSGSITPTVPLRLGKDNRNNYYVSTLDDIRIYKKALTSGEVSQLYNNGAGTEVE